MRYASFFVGLLLSLAGKGQKILPADSALANFRTLYPQEKVFLQTDKEAYVPGETIWMKAWCALDETPSYLSRVLYVDLVNSDGRVVLKKMYMLDSLSSTGADFDLPAGMATGTYSLNAYTLWMLNFPNYLFKKNVVVYGEDYDPKAKPKTENSPSVVLRFFPEGGDLISGAVNRVAFKATSNGFPCNGKGQIVDKAGKKVADFSPEHDGMGVTEFLFEDGNEYTAVFTPAVGRASARVVLPKAKEEGVGLKVENNSPNRLFVLVNRAAKNKERFSTVRVVATLNYQTVFSRVLDLDKDENACAINKKQLPAGILHISLFDRNNLPLAERLTFIENYDLKNPAVAVETKGLKPGEKGVVGFRLDGVDRPALSCLVTGYASGDSTTHFAENIASSLLLTSDLRGYVHNPGFYFKDKTASTLHCLDLLLMTQGWRRYEWNKIQRNEFASLKYPVESAISFRGTVYKSDSKEKITDGKVSFIIKGVDSTSILAEATVTDKGEFLLPNITYAKSAVVAYMGTNNKKQNYIVDVKLEPNYIDSLRVSDNGPSVRFDTARFDSQSALAKTLWNNVEEQRKNAQAKMLETVTIKAKKLSPADSLNIAYAGGPFLMGRAVNPGEYKNYHTIWQMIQAAVPGVTVEGNPFDPTVTFSRFAAFGGGSGSQSVSESSNGEISQSVVMETGGIAYFLNEVNVSKDVINTLTVDDIALIKVLKNEAAALGASQGAIAIYTKQDVGVGQTVYDKRYAKQKSEGFAISKQFYQPEALSSGNRPDDTLYTLFWTSRIIPSPDGNYRFHFYNNSTFSRLRFVVQGMDKKGALIYKDYIIE